MARIRRNWSRPAAREAARLDRIADRLDTIPVLTPITARARPLNPALWGDLGDDAA